MCFLRDAVDTRKPPLMEVALDAIQKLISFKLLQGSVHHINHRCGVHAVCASGQAACFFCSSNQCCAATCTAAVITHSVAVCKQATKLPRVLQT